MAFVAKKQWKICKSCADWINLRCTKINRATNRLAIDFNRRKCDGCHDNANDQKETLHDGVKIVTDFSYLGDKINSGGGFEAAVRIWIDKLIECLDLLCGNKYPLNIKGIVYRSCVRSAMLHGSETWCLC